MQMENDYNLLTRMKNSSFIFQTKSTFVKNAVSYFKEEKMYFGTLLTLWLSTHLIGDFFAWLGSDLLSFVFACCLSLVTYNVNPFTISNVW